MSLETEKTVKIGPEMEWKTTCMPEDTSKISDNPVKDGEQAGPPPDMSGFDEIKRLMRDSEMDPAVASRRITQVLADLVAEQAIMRNDRESWKSKYRVYAELIKHLRETGRQLLDTEVLSKKDILRFDGEKFQYVLGRIVELFVKAMKEAGFLEDQRNNVMHHYRDLMAMAEQGIRRDTDKIESSLRRK